MDEDIDTNGIFFKIFLEGFTLGMKIGEQNVDEELSTSEIIQRCRNRFENMMKEMNS